MLSDDVMVQPGEGERQREVVEDRERALTIDDQVVALVGSEGLS
ncbi:hypothetical protein [Cryobacterium sp. Y29]|nr:hypothetical protein [Cryobacterium sp. Y29]